MMRQKCANYFVPAADLVLGTLTPVSGSEYWTGFLSQWDWGWWKRAASWTDPFHCLYHFCLSVPSPCSRTPVTQAADQRERRRKWWPAGGEPAACGKAAASVLLAASA